MGLWEVIGPWKWSLQEQDSCPYRESTESAGTMILDFLAFRTMRNKCLGHTVYSIFVTGADRLRQTYLQIFPNSFPNFVLILLANWSCFLSTLFLLLIWYRSCLVAIICFYICLFHWAVDSSGTESMSCFSSRLQNLHGVYYGRH